MPSHLQSNLPEPPSEKENAAGGKIDPSPRRVSPLHPFLPAAMGALGVVVLMFGGYEIVERIWLSDISEEARNNLHRIRGVLTALLVGVTVGWIVIRSSPALLTATAVEEDLQAERVREQRIRLYVQWFIAMRWIAVLVAGNLVFLGVKVFELLPWSTWWPLVGTVGALAASNILYSLMVHRSVHPRSLLISQAYADLVILAVLLHFSGGTQNPLAVFMLFHVIIGGILLSKAECYRLAAAGSLLFAAVAFGELLEILPHHPFMTFSHDSGGSPVHEPAYVLPVVGVHWAILFLVAFFVTTLAERLRRNERRVIALADRALADRQLLEQALESTRTGMRILTPSLVPVSANQRWKDWFGEIGQACQISPDLPNIGCPARECLLKGELDSLEFERTAADNRRQHFHLASAPVLDSRGALSGVVQLAHDITAQKRAHDRMMRAGQMAAVGELAGQIAHEVNNPIAVINAKASLLLKNQRREMSDKIAEDLGKIMDYTERVARIAQGLLSYSMPSPTVRRPVDLRAPIRKSISMIEHRALNREITIEDKLPDTPITAKANAAEMEQVFLNLFINAIQAMEKGGRMTISLVSFPGKESSNSTLAIAVDDTGGGIPPEIRERVFEPFFTTKQDNHGTGLGLSICQGLLRSHQGEIVIEDAPGGGARFVVRLPSE